MGFRQQVSPQRIALHHNAHNIDCDNEYRRYGKDGVERQCRPDSRRIVLQPRRSRFGDDDSNFAYEVDLARAERDVMDFVSEMKSAGLVEVPAAVAMA